MFTPDVVLAMWHEGSRDQAISHAFQSLQRLGDDEGADPATRRRNQYERGLVWLYVGEFFWQRRELYKAARALFAAVADCEAVGHLTGRPRVELYGVLWEYFDARPDTHTEAVLLRAGMEQARYTIYRDPANRSAWLTLANGYRALGAPWSAEVARDRGNPSDDLAG